MNQPDPNLPNLSAQAAPAASALKTNTTAQAAAPARTRRLKWVVVGVLCVVAGIGGVWAYRSHAQQAETAEIAAGFFRQDRTDVLAQENTRTSALFDISAVNKSLRQRGLQAETVADAAGTSEEDDRRTPALNRSTSGLNAEMQNKQLSQNTAEVYFDPDASWQERAQQQAQQGAIGGSSETSRLMPQTDIIGSASVDSLDQAVYKATRMSVPEMEGVFSKQSRAKRSSGYFGGSSTRRKKAAQDLAQTFLLSLSAAQQKSPMMQKQLAAAGSLAATVPPDAYKAVEEGSGVRILGNETVGTPDKSRQILQQEKNCQQLGKQANQQITEKLNTAKDLIRALRSGIPDNCGAVAVWKENLWNVKNICRDIQSIYSQMKKECDIVVSDMGKCESLALDNYTQQWTESCQAWQVAQALPPSAPDKEKQIADAERVIADLSQPKSGISKEDVVYAFNVEVDGLGGENNFFPR